jgi:hypothetical protein
MSETTITKYFYISGVLTDPTSMKLSDSGGTYGVKRSDNDAVVVADGADMVKISTGVYQYTFTDPDYDLTYDYTTEIVYDGLTYHFDATKDGTVTPPAGGETTITKYFYHFGVLTDPDSIVFSEPNGTYGVRRSDTDATVVADGVALTKVDTGVYQHTFDDPAFNLTYEYYIEIEHDGQVFFFSEEKGGTVSPGATGDLNIANEAIALLGGQTLTDFTDNTEEARLVEQFYTSAIRQTLRDYDWAFATKRSSELTVLDDEPEFEWSYQYQLPADCIRVISVYGDPDFVIEGDVLLINESGDVYILYIYLITDISLFDSLFRRALVRRLAADMAYSLTKKQKKEEEMILLYERAISKAKAKDRKESHNVARTPATGDSWIKSRT